MMTNERRHRADGGRYGDPAFYRLLNEEQAAREIGYSVRALQNWRVRGGGPKFVRVSSRSIRYRLCDLIEWADERLVANTSQALRS